MIKVTVNKDKVASELNGKEEVIISEIVMVITGQKNIKLNMRIPPSPCLPLP